MKAAALKAPVAVPHHLLRRSFSLLLASLGGALAAGGAELLMLGGSGYYLPAGMATLAAAWLVWRGDRRGAWIYAALLASTLVWALWERGPDPWPLIARLFAPAMLGLPFLLPALRPAGWPGLAPAMLAPALICSLAFTVRPQPIGSVAGPAHGPAAARSGAGAGDDWPVWGGDPGGSRFSRLTQLNSGSVGRLQVAWTYRTGVPEDGKLGNLEVTPLKIGNRLFICSNLSTVDALDPETGRRIWRFDPKVDLKQVTNRACRGVAFVRTGGEDCPERIIAPALDAGLWALDVRTGRPCRSFGEGGRIDLTRGMGEISPGFYYPTSAPTIVRNKVIVGGWVTDGQGTGSPSGVVRAFDIQSGAFAWAWDLGRPDHAEEPRAGETYSRGTPNVWAPMSGDEELGLVYLPTGNATPDYYGAHRTADMDRYSSSLVALDADTGAVRWTFQTVHHDLWDYDVPAQPTLVDLRLAGEVVPALVQATKGGQLFVLDRRTGRPIRRVEERPVPRQGAPGERVAATQPISVAMPSLIGPRLTEARMWGLTPLDQLWCRTRFRRARFDGPMTPPGLRPTIQQPGFMGAVSWGGVAVDPDRAMLLVNSTRLPTWHRLVPRREANKLGVVPRGTPGWRPVSGYWPQAGVPFAAEAKGFLSPLGIPCSEPPYGVLTAVDLRSGRRVWEQPLGTARDSGPLGIRTGLPLPMGVPNTGGILVTAAGIAFVGATQEESLRAIDLNSGRVLWSARLPAGGHATPMTYRSAASGRQFIVIAAGGKNLLQTRLGDYLIAYALPSATEGSAVPR